MFSHQSHCISQTQFFRCCPITRSYMAMLPYQIIWAAAKSESLLPLSYTICQSLLVLEWPMGMQWLHAYSLITLGWLILLLYLFMHVIRILSALDWFPVFSSWFQYCNGGDLADYLQGNGCPICTHPFYNWPNLSHCCISLTYRFKSPPTSVGCMFILPIAREGTLIGL